VQLIRPILQVQTSVYRDFDIAWGRQANALMVVYAKPAVNYCSYWYQPLGGAATNGNCPDVGGVGQWIVVRAHPFANEFACMDLDNANDVNLSRWNGSAWSVVSEVETASSVQYNSIDFAYRNETNAIPAP
jgi:hypothetical protein